MTDREGPAPRLNLIYLYVRDLERSLTFYRDALGLPLQLSSAGTWAEVQLPGGLRFALNAADGYAPPTPRTAEICFATDDLARARSQLQAAGVQGTEVEVGAWGGHFHVYDPDGYRLSLYVPRRPTQDGATG